MMAGSAPGASTPRGSTEGETPCSTTPGAEVHRSAHSCPHVQSLVVDGGRAFQLSRENSAEKSTCRRLLIQYPIWIRSQGYDSYA